MSEVFSVDKEGYTAEDRHTMARIRSDYEFMQHGARYVGGVLRLTGFQVEDLRYTPEEHLEHARQKAWAEFYNRTPAQLELQQSVAAKWQTLAAEIYPEHDFATHHAVVTFLLNGKGTPKPFQRKRVVLDTTGEALGIGSEYAGRFGPRFTYAEYPETPTGTIAIHEPHIESTVEPIGQPLRASRDKDEPIATELLFSGSGYNKHRIIGVVDLRPLTDTELAMLNDVLGTTEPRLRGY